MTSPGLLHAEQLAHVPHAFTTRTGGVSRGIFSSLNFGNPGDLPAPERDPDANIHANYRRVLEALDCSSRELVEVHQVHGNVVHVVHSGAPAHPTPHDTRADAIVTDDPTRILAIRTADCAPILLASDDGRVVAAVHAGWRGVVSGALPAAVAAMRSLGARAIAAAVGPCIGPDAFEVGDDVASAFHTLLGPSTPRIRSAPGRPGKHLADLPGALLDQIAAVGVTSAVNLGLCTVARPDLFFSHRRDAGRTGRMTAVIGCRARPQK